MPFLCTAFDFGSVDLLVDELKVESLKVASSEVTNLRSCSTSARRERGSFSRPGRARWSKPDPRLRRCSDRGAGTGCCIVFRVIRRPTTR
jgi:sialic acid synthase SpsE